MSKSIRSSFSKTYPCRHAVLVSVIDVFARFARNHIDHRLTKPHGCSKAKRTNVRKRIKKSFHSSHRHLVHVVCSMHTSVFKLRPRSSKKKEKEKKILSPSTEREETLFRGRQLATLAALSFLGLHPPRKKIFFPSFFFEKTWNLRLAWCVDKHPLVSGAGSGRAKTAVQNFAGHATRRTDRLDLLSPQ